MRFRHISPKYFLIAFALVGLIGCKAEPKKTTHEISSFSFLAATNAALSADVQGTISGTTITLTVPYGTDQTALVATFDHNGVSVTSGSIPQQSGVTANDFSSSSIFGNIYNVAAEDNTSVLYYVNVLVDATKTHEFSSFSFLAAKNTALSSDIKGTISGTTITAAVPYGTSRTGLIASFEHDGISVTSGGVDQKSGVTVNDFSSSETLGKIYTVTAEDAGTAWHSVKVSETAPTASTIGALSGGSAVTVIGYGLFGAQESTVTVTPYTKGFKIKFTPVAAGAFICSLSNSVIQSGSQKSFNVTASITGLPSTIYNGYIESGASDTCATYKVETVWTIFSDAVEFDPTKPYTVDLSDVDAANGVNQVISITP